jgi:hypothetical protein
VHILIEYKNVEKIMNYAGSNSILNGRRNVTASACQYIIAISELLDISEVYLG